MRVTLCALAAGLLLAASGCGGEDSAATGGEGAASIAPASAAAYVTINTDIDSDQVNQLEELLAKFPDRERLIAELQKSLAEEELSWETDIKPALGETLDIVFLDFQDAFVAVLKPADKAKFEALLAKSDEPTVSREIDGWTVVAQTEAVLDRFETARDEGALEDDEQFENAMGELPDEALAKLYVDGDAATRAAESSGAGATGDNKLTAFAAALGAESSGIRLEGALTSELEEDYASIEPYEAKLIESAPEGALAFISGNGFGRVDEALRQAPGSVEGLQEMLGIDLDGVLGLFNGEFAFWVAPGAPIPELTFLAEVENEAAAMAAVERLTELIPPELRGPPRTTEVEGLEARQIVLEGFPITYATFDGRLIVTSRPGAIADVRESGDSLAEDPDFKEAAENAGMEDATFGFLYVNVEGIAELVQGFAGAAGEEVPPEVARNLEPLGSFVFSSGGKTEDLKLSAFLSIE